MHGPLHNLHLLGCHRPLALQLGQLRQHRLQTLPQQGRAGTDRRSSADPGGGLAGGELQDPGQESAEVGETVCARQFAGSGIGVQTVIDQGQPVAEGFEALPPADLLGGIEVVQTTGFNCF